MGVTSLKGFERPVDGREGLILFFKVKSHTYGIRLTNVVRIDETATPAPTITLPDEKVIKCINLQRFFGTGGNGSNNEGNIVIVFDSEDGQYGLVADAVDEIVPAQEASELSWPPLLKCEGSKIFGGFFRRREKLVPAVNASAIREAAMQEGL